MILQNEQRRIVAYLIGLPPIGDLRQAKVNALPAPPVPTFFVGGSFGAGVTVCERGGVVRVDAVRVG